MQTENRQTPHSYSSMISFTFPILLALLPAQANAQMRPTVAYIATVWISTCRSVLW